MGAAEKSRFNAANRISQSTTGAAFLIHWHCAFAEDCGGLYNEGVRQRNGIHPKTFTGLTLAQSLHVACVISIGSPS